MAKITISDVTVTGDITVGNDSLAAAAGLRGLDSGATQYVRDELPKSVQTTTFQTATLGAAFQSPKIALDSKRSLIVKSGVNSTLTRFTDKDKTLLGADPTVPKIEIGSNECWMSFSVKSTLEVGGTEPVGSGFGVSLKFGSAVTLTGYSRFPSVAGRQPTLGEAIGTTLTNFGLLASAAEIRRQMPGTVRSADTSGTVTVGGSYSLPISVNQLALAEAIIPFKFAVNPAICLKVGGSVAITGDFCSVCWRSSETTIVLALLKKKGTTLTASFNAGAGLAAPVGNSDLIETFFKAVAPGIDLAESGLTKEDPRYKAINDVLTDSISRAFSISANATCAASMSDQSALVYEVELPPETDAASTAKTDGVLDAALGGDWSLLSTLPNARELRNVVGAADETKFTLPVNLLGLFNYESVSNFVSNSTVVHDIENASVTITDKSTAKRITIASTPYLADSDKLRAVLYEAVLATAAYKMAGGKFTPDFTMNQSVLKYAAKRSTADLRKDLRLAVLIGELTPAQLDAIPMVNPRHVLIDASQALDNTHLMRIFFADPATKSSHTIEELTRIGRQTLAALLDPANPVDVRRITVLSDDAAWHDMDESGGKPPSDSPASYSDWYDVTFWANAIHDAAQPLKAAIDALDEVPAGSDPSEDRNFMGRRDVLKKAIGKVTHETHAAFDFGWPIAVMYALSGGNTGAALRANWNGDQHVPLPQVAAIPTAAALAKRSVA